MVPGPPLLRSLFIPALLFFFLGLAGVLNAQERVHVFGKVRDTLTPGPVYNLMVVSRQTGHGFFGEMDGTFKVRLLRGDTLLISVPGYQIERIPISGEGDTLHLEIPLRKLSRTLQMVDIFPQRELDEVSEDLQDNPLPKAPDLQGTADALTSPITYLYERFSRFERSKREVSRLEYLDRRTDLLKELFRIYVDNRIIDLKDEEFDAFIRYLNLPDEFIRSASQYDLVVAIKGRYERWVSLRETYRDH